MSFVWKVSFESFKKESSGLSDSLELKEDLENTFNWSLWIAVGVTSSDHFGKVSSSLWVERNHRSHDLDPVWRVSSLLAVRKNRVELLGFNESLDDFVRSTSSLEHLKSH